MVCLIFYVIMADISDSERMFLAKLHTVAATFKEFFPEDRIDIQIPGRGNGALKAIIEGYDSLSDDEKELLYINGLNMNIIIHYDSIELTNDAGHKYTIYDVYVRHQFPDVTMCLARASYTEDEIQVGYIHSHVPINAFTSFGSFCLGSSTTPVNVAKINLCNAIYSENSDVPLETLTNIYIIQVERTLKIESNEGVPYITFEKVGTNYNKEPISIIPSLYSTISLNRIRAFAILYSNLRLDDFYYDGMSWQLKATDTEFIKRVTNVAKKSKITLNSMYQEVYYMGGLYYFKQNNYRRSAIHDGTVVAFRFKGSTPKIKILQNNTDSEYTKVTILDIRYITKIYNYLINLINGIYAIQSKDNFRTMSYKIKTQLLKDL